MRLSMQCDLSGARARSEERAWCLIPFSQASLGEGTSLRQLEQLGSSWSRSLGLDFGCKLDPGG